LKGLLEAIWAKYLGRNDFMKMSWLLSTGQNGGNDVKFWASLARKTCTLEAETLLSD